MLRFGLHFFLEINILTMAKARTMCGSKFVFVCCVVALLIFQVVADKEPHEESKEDDSVSTNK